MTFSYRYNKSPDPVDRMTAPVESMEHVYSLTSENMFEELVGEGNGEGW